jgi:hypothetical protein
MTDKTPKSLIPTWGYHATDGARIFNLPEGEHLPKDWHDHPDKAKQPEPKSSGPKVKFTTVEGDKTK